MKGGDDARDIQMPDPNGSEMDEYMQMGADAAEQGMQMGAEAAEQGMQMAADAAEKAGF